MSYYSYNRLFVIDKNAITIMWFVIDNSINEKEI